MKIVIPGDPIAQARMRHCGRGRFIKVYDPKAKEKKEIRGFLSSLESKPPALYPRVSFLFHMKIPSGLNKKDMALYQSGRVKHIKKPDVDNLVKLYLDCLDGIFLDGDQAVSLGPCIKVYDSEPKTIIWITESSQLLESRELDLAFLDASGFDKSSFYGSDSPGDLCDPEL